MAWTNQQAYHKQDRNKDRQHPETLTNSSLLENIEVSEPLLSQGLGAWPYAGLSLLKV